MIKCVDMHNSLCKMAVEVWAEFNIENCFSFDLLRKKIVSEMNAKRDKNKMK